MFRQLPVASCQLPVALILFVIGSWSLAAEVAPPLSPENAQIAFVLADSSLKIELAAAEPEVIDPVAIRFDEDGRMWVVEMRDYPLGNPAGGEPLSRIRILEDKDADSRFETATTFADKLLFVTGLQPWKGGVFVTLSGRLAYMKDTDGDGRADLDETWFEGFAELNSQLRANHPRLALDNWIYVANGLRGGKVINRKLNETEPINISGMDFRFHPLTGACEAVSGNGQFGLCFDDWGNRFNCSNRNPVRHVVIEDRYLKANPNVTVPATVNDVAAFGEQSRIFPISRAWTTSNLHAGQFTAACGVYIYRGDLLPAEFKGNVFTCDPTGNLIHREIMQPAGPTFTSKPAYDGKEFLASPDEWFRPVNMELGPDGALYVVDMYRCVIEHPDFVPDELKRRPDLRLGDDRGRIWRIVGRSDTDRPALRVRPAFSKKSNDELVSLLSHPNAWQRETAHRLLLESDGREASPILRRLANGAESSQARVRAMWLLAAFGDLSVSDLQVGIADEDVQVRRQVALIAERVPVNTKGRISLIELTNDPSAVVRFQGRLSWMLTPREGKIDLQRLISMAPKEAADPWLRASIRIYCGATDADIAGPILANLPKDRGQISPGELSLVQELSELGGKSDGDQAGFISGFILARLRHSGEPRSAVIALLGLMRGLSSRRITARDSIGNRQAADIEAALRALIASDETEIETRRDALSVLAFFPNSTSIVSRFASIDHDQSIRIAAIAALARHPVNENWSGLLHHFSSETPPIRRAIIDGLLSNTERAKLLLDAIESGQIKASEIDLAQAKRLTAHRDASIKDRAEKLFAAAMPADRAKALADYQPVLAMKGDAIKGQAIFEKNCSACHRIAGIGSNVAPDISDSRTKKFDQLLADILQPNRAIDNNYVGYTVRQLDGTVLTGILTAETATSITLKEQGGKETVIPRSEIDELRSSGQSLMPEGLERQIPPAEMADLLSFIKNWRYLDGRTPLSDSQN